MTNKDPLEQAWNAAHESLEKIEGEVPEWFGQILRMAFYIGAISAHDLVVSDLHQKLSSVEFQQIILTNLRILHGSIVSEVVKQGMVATNVRANEKLH